MKRNDRKRNDKKNNYDTKSNDMKSNDTKSNHIKSNKIKSNKIKCINRKRSVSIILIGILLLSTLSGCRKNTKDRETDAEQANALGRYVEEEVAFPQGVEPEEFITLTKTPDGGIELYAYNDGNYEKYKYVKKEWERDIAEGLHTFKSSYLISDIFYGEDGKQYLSSNTLEYKYELYRLSEKGEYEKILIQKFEEVYEQKQDYKKYYRPNSLKILENGMIAVSYNSGDLLVYSSDGQSVVSEIVASPRSYNIGAVGNILYYISQKGNEIIGLDIERNEQVETRPMEFEITYHSKLDIDKEKAYFCDTTGIHLMMKGGSIWETIVDGSLNSLSMPSVELQKFIIGTKEDFYCVMTESFRKLMKHYYFDENACSIPPIELSIFSLQDSRIIRQVMVMFQESHPDVRINYRVAKRNGRATYTYGIKDSKDPIPQSDYVKALNTELLANKGADILVLDGLPVTSYIEKGVLEDMSDIFLPREKELLENIAGNYWKNGKVYTMPVRFKIPTMFGSSEAINASNSVNKLADYALKSKEVPLLVKSNYRAMAAWLLLLYYDQILNDKKEIDIILLQNFLENMNVIANNIGASDDAEITAFGPAGGVILVGYWGAGIIDTHKKLVQSDITEMREIEDFAVPLAAAKVWEGGYKVINNTFAGNCLVGINKAGKQKELAKEFVEFLFSDKVQSLKQMDGFPMNEKVLKEWIDKDVNYSGSLSSDDYIINNVSYPERKIREKIYDDIVSLSKPMENDNILIDMILDEAERYLRGDITSEQAAKNAISSITAYQNE